VDRSAADDRPLQRVRTTADADPAAVVTVVAPVPPFVPADAPAAVRPLVRERHADAPSWLAPRAPHEQLPLPLLDAIGAAVRRATAATPAQSATNAPAPRSPSAPDWSARRQAAPAREPAGVPQPGRASTKIELDRVVEKAERRLLHRLAIERERRGIPR
jgi:hypothetical protein